MDYQLFLLELIEIGREGELRKLSIKLASLAERDTQCRHWMQWGQWGSDAHLSAIIKFAGQLKASDLTVFLMAVSTLEDRLGGLKSVSTLQYLLPLLQSTNKRNTLDWILRNTCSYEHFSSAKSLEDYDAISLLTSENIERDNVRKAKDKTRIARACTIKLYNAVRRGDIKAVQGLLTRGADPHALSPGGKGLSAFAKDEGMDAIAQLLDSTVLDGSNDIDIVVCTPRKGET